MRIPLVRFGNDRRPIEPWEERLIPVVVPILIPLLFVVFLMMSVVSVVLFLGWACVSPVLPRPWRLDWNKALSLDPSVNAECPACRARLTLGSVDPQGYVMRTDNGREIIRTAQSATCLQCQRAFTRYSHGKIWSPWQEAQPPDHRQ
jgi:hypothetical protein